jgi:geranylgeranylglycerol-phosphate geranylgeranyltransferase
VAGYLMGAPEKRKNDLLLLSIPVLASAYFFTRYAIRFPRSDSAKTSPDELGSPALAKAEWFYFFWIFIPHTAFVIYYVSRSETISYQILLSLGLFVGLFISYGRFLPKNGSSSNQPSMRHWLIWPVILSIAIGLFYGLSFSYLKISLLPLFPVILVVYLFAASLKLSRRLYLWLNLLVLLGVTTVSVLNQTGYIALPPILGLSSMLFCVAASAYLAVFEAASITSEIAQNDQNDTRALRYAQATLVALTATVWLLPFYYIFSSFGPAFLIGFAVHAFTSFIIWFHFGEGSYLRKWRWSDMKLIPGLLFLGLLVLSSTPFFSQPWSFHFIKRFPNWGFGILAAIVASLVTLLVKNFVVIRDKDDVKAPLSELFKNRINFTRILSLLCFVFCCGIALRLPYVDEAQPGYSRAELACLVYMICVVLCPLMEIKELFRPKPTLSQTGKSVLGILLIIRAFTSTLIALTVFLPLYWAGVSIIESLYSSIPFFCAAAGGFAINDYYDLPKDRINKPYRAIPSGKIKPRLALSFGVTLIVAGTLISVSVSHSRFQLFLYLISIVGVGLYNLVVKYLSLSKTVLTAAISVLPILYVTTTLSYPSIYLLIPMAGVFFLLGRELLMDIRDINGDRLSHMKTLPMVIGSRATARIAFFLFALCGSILMFFTIEVWSVRNATLTSIILSSSFILPYPWSYRGGKYRRSVILSLYVPILCGILLLVR